MRAFLTVIKTVISTRRHPSQPQQAVFVPILLYPIDTKLSLSVATKVRHRKNILLIAVHRQCEQ